MLTCSGDCPKRLMRPNHAPPQCPQFQLQAPIPVSLVFAVSSSTGSLQREQVGNSDLKARFERSGIVTSDGNHQIAQETVAQNGARRRDV